MPNNSEKALAPAHRPNAALAHAPPANLKQDIGKLAGEPLNTFLICLFVWTFVNFEQSLFGYAIPEMIDEFNVDIEIIGLIISVGFGFAIVGAIIAGILADRYGRRNALVGSFAFSSIFYALQGLAPGVWLLAAARSLGAGGSAGISPISNSYVAEVAPPRLRSLMVGFLQMGFPLGWFLASILVVPLLTHFGWRAIFLVSFLGVPISFLIYRVLKESKRFERVQAVGANKVPSAKQLGDLFTRDLRRTTTLAILAFFCQGGAYAGLAFYLPTFLHEVRGYETTTAVAIVGSSYGIAILGYLSASIVGEFFLSRKATIMIWTWTGALALIWFVWWPERPSQDVLALGIMAIFSYGTAAILTTFLLEQFPTRVRATGAACASASVSLGFAVLPVLVAVLVGQIGWQLAVTLCVGPLMFLCGLAVLFMRGGKAGEAIADV